MQTQQIVQYLGQFNRIEQEWEEQQAAAAENAGATPARNSDYDRNHIFYAILEYALQHSKEKARYNYYYSLSQKLLRTSQARDKYIASYFLQKLENPGEGKLPFENEIAYHALYSIFNPAIAYYYYFLEHDYARAWKFMEDSLVNIDFLLQHGFDDGMYMKIEQYLNSFRVHLLSGNTEEAIRYGRDVMAYLLSSRQEQFEFPFSKVMNSSRQLSAILTLFYNGILYKTLAQANDDEFFQHPMLQAIFGGLDVPYNKVLEPELAKTADAFRMIVNGNEEAARDIILSADVFQKHIPSSLRFFILAWLLQQGDVHEKLDEATKNSIFKYRQREFNLTGTLQHVFDKVPVTV